MPPDDFDGRFGVCVNTDAATVLTAADDFGLTSSFAAIDATLGDVDSVFFAILAPSACKPNLNDNAIRDKLPMLMSVTSQKAVVQLFRFTSEYEGKATITAFCVRFSDVLFYLDTKGFCVKLSLTRIVDADNF